MAPEAWPLALLAASVLGLAAADIPDGRWHGGAPWHHEELWTRMSTAADERATDCAYLGSLELPASAEFPAACRSRALVLGGDTFDAKADGSKCYFKRCGAYGDIKFTDKYGARDTHTILVGGWRHLTRSADGLGTECPYLGSYEVLDLAQFPASCESRAAVLGADTFDFKPDRSKCYFKRCGAVADMKFSDKFGAHDCYTVLGRGFSHIVSAADGVATLCPFVAEYALENSSHFPMACYSKAASMGADSFDAKPDGTKCYLKKCGSFGDIDYTTKFGSNNIFTTLGGRWSQITRAADGRATDCPYLGSYELPDPGDFPQACYSRALVMGGDTFDAKTDGSKCYFKKCGAFADIKFTDKYGARDTHTILGGGWSQITLASEARSTDCPYLGSYEVENTSTFPMACFSQAVIKGGDTFDAKTDGSKCYVKKCGAFQDVKYTDKYGARDSYTTLFPRGGDDWGPCDPAVCLDFHLMYTSKVGGRFLPVGGAGETCDPADSQACFGGTARRIAYVEQKREEFARRSESTVFLDMGGSTFGGPVWSVPGYPDGRAGTILQNLIPYDFCILSPRDFLSGSTDEARRELAESFGNRTCTFLLANAKLNGLWEGFNSKVSNWMVKEMHNGWKVAFIGMMPFSAGRGYSYGPNIITVDPDSLFARVRSGVVQLQASAESINAQMKEFSEDFEKMQGHLLDVVTLTSLVPVGVLAAAAEAKRLHPDLKATVLLAPDDERQDQIEWLARHGDFDVVLREYGVEEPVLIQSAVSAKQVLVAASETTFGVGHLKVRLRSGAGVEKFSHSPDIALDATIPTNQTVEAVMSELYSGIRERNLHPYGGLTNPLLGGSRGDEAPPTLNQCYYMECNAGTVIGQALLWKARSEGYRVDTSLYNLGGLRNTLRGDANGTVFIGHCIEALKFQNSLKLFKIMGKDLFAGIKKLMLVEERGFIGAGVRVAFHEPCFDYVSHSPDFVWERLGAPGTEAEMQRCVTESGVSDPEIKIIDMEVAHVDWGNCSDYTRCASVQWKTLEKGTSYTLVATDYLASVLVGFEPLEISLGTDAAALCDYVAAQHPLEVESWEGYLSRGNKQYTTAQEGWAAGMRVTSVRTAVSIIEPAPTCPDGMYLPERASACQPCPAGSHSTEEATRHRCRLCALGFFADQPQSATCSPCPAGYFASMPGSTACIACGPGTVSDTGAIYCNECRPGQHAPTAASRECLACPVGTFVAVSGSSACTPCGGGLVTRYPAAVSVEKCLCPEGSYRPYERSSPSQPPGSACARCPLGMTCAFGSDMRPLLLSDNRTGEFPRLLPRYWSSAEAPLSVFHCRSPDRCPGGKPGSSCASLLTGQACEHCGTGFYWSGKDCVECLASPLLFPVIPAVMVPAVVTAMYFSSRDPIEKWNSWKNSISCQVFVLLNFYQTLSLLHSTAVPLPKGVRSAYGSLVITTDYTSIFKANCVSLDTFQTRTMVNALMPLVVVILALLTMLASGVVARQTGKSTLHMQYTGVQHVIGSLLFTFFNGIAGRALTLFKCAENPSGKWTLAEDGSVTCFESGAWQSMLIVGIFSVLVYCVLTGAAFVRAVLLAPREENFSNPTFQWRWKFLFIKYRSEVYWFGLVLLGKNFLLNVGFVVFSDGLAQIYWIMGVTTLYAGTVSVFRPFRYTSSYLVDLISGVAILYGCTFIIPFAETAGTLSDTVLMNMVIAMSLLPTSIGLVCEARKTLKALLRPQELGQRSQEAFKSIRHSCAQLALMPVDDGTDLLMSIGEWDRHCMKGFSKIVESEVLGQGGMRLSSDAICKRFRSVAHKSSRAVMRMSASSGSYVPVGRVESNPDKFWSEPSTEDVKADGTVDSKSATVVQAVQDLAAAEPDDPQAVSAIAQCLSRGEVAVPFLRAIARMAAAGNKDAIAAASMLVEEPGDGTYDGPGKDSIAEVIELSGSGVVSTDAVKSMII